MTSPHDHSHDHDHGHPHSHDLKLTSTALKNVMLITVTFMGVEIAAGWYSQSLALLSDAVHMFSDVAAIGLSYFALWISQRPSTPRMSFGFHRAEILGGLASGLSIFGLVGVFIYQAVMRFQSPVEVLGPVAAGVSGLGLLVNLYCMRELHSAQDHSLNIRGAYLHVLMDCLGSVAALVSGLVIWFTGWNQIDTIVTLISATLMVGAAWGLVKESIEILMESAPRKTDPVAVKRDLEALAQVKGVHDLHIWSVGHGKLALSVHLISPVTPDEVLLSANAILEEQHGILHTTIQVEHPDRFKSERCFSCAGEG